MIGKETPVCVCALLREQAFVDMRVFYEWRMSGLFVMRVYVHLCFADR
jgi:hypothetical protein